MIDDDADECQLIEEALARLNIPNRLLCFSDGKEAIAYLTETTERPFLILSDINMPGMGGLELRRHINENENLKRKSIPFIFLTTSATPHAVGEAYKMSVQGFFEKPHDMREIAGLLKEICSYWKRCRHPNN